MSAPLDAIRRDLRQAVRALRHAPGFAATAIATLAIAIAATTIVFGVIDGVLLRALPYRDSQRLVNVFEANEDGTGFRLPSYPTYLDWQRQTDGAASPFAGTAYVRGNQVEYRRDEGVERVGAAFVTPGFFALLGAPPLVGRTFTADEEQPGGARVAVVSFAFWKTELGGDPAAIGRRVDLDGQPTTIVGVMPNGFAYPTFASVWAPIATIVPTDAGLAKRALHVDARVLARLRADGDSARAATAMRTVARRLAAEYPAEQAHWTGVSLQPVRDELLGTATQPMLLALGGAVLMVLLLACANVANLSLVRLAGRGRELAIRAALGAGRGVVVRQLLTESALVAATGGAAGVAIAATGVSLVRRAWGGVLPRGDAIALDWRVAAFAVAVTAGAALLAGLLPALRASPPASLAALRAGGRGATGGAGDARVRATLAALQLALALVLLVGAGLLLRSFRRVQEVPLGFDPDGLVAVAIAPPPHRYAEPAQAAALYDRLIDAVRAVPGVENAAVTNHLPLTGAFVPSVARVPGRPSRRDDERVLYRTASAGYLTTMRMTLRRGRWFTADDMRSPTGFVINETMAKQFWPGADPIGQPLEVHRASQARPDFGQPIDGVVLGVVADVHQQDQGSDPAPEVYVPSTQEVWPWASLVVRVRDPERSSPALRRAVLGVDPAIPLRSGGGGIFGGIVTVRSLVASTVVQRRIALTMATVFAATALLLATLGLYGVVAHGVAQRTREVGVRMALGATPAAMLRLIVGQGARVVVAGAVLGLAGALAATRLIQAMLFRTPAWDPWTYAAVTALLAAVAIAASWLPARRAARLDPTLALRGE